MFALTRPVVQTLLCDGVSGGNLWETVLPNKVLPAGHRTYLTAEASCLLKLRIIYFVSTAVALPSLPHFNCRCSVFYIRANFPIWLH